LKIGVCASERINNIPALLGRRERNLLENTGRRGLRRHERQLQVASAPKFRRLSVRHQRMLGPVC